MIMTMSDEVERLQNMVEQAHCELNKLKETTYLIVEDRRRYRDILELVRDAGRPHSQACDCDQCQAYALVKGELAK